MASQLASSSASYDSFAFSDEIERELAQLEANGSGGGGFDHAAGALADLDPVDRPAVRHTGASAAARAAAANPQAYAEAHFGRVTSANGSAYRSGGGGGGSGAHAHLSIDPDRGSSSHRRVPSGSWRSSSASAVGASAFASAASASPSSEDEHRAFYDEEAGLGGTSFPLLPHNSVYDDELLAQEQMAMAGMGARMNSSALGLGLGLGAGPDQAFSPSGRVHSQHLTSILNQPASRLQHAAGPAISGASGFLPSLSSIWTFATGVQPPDAVSRVSEELSAFAEEAAASDYAPFVLPPCPHLDAADLQLASVAHYLQVMQPVAEIYRRNHPREGFAHRMAALKAEKAQASARTQMARDRARAPPRKSRHDDNGSDGEDSPYAHFSASSAAAAAAYASPSAGAAPAAVAVVAPSDPQHPPDDPVGEALLARDLQDCYDSIPSVYFSEDFQLSSLEFWKDQRDLSFVCEQQRQTREQAGGGGDGAVHGSGATTPGGTPINPYASFNALTSYQSSSHFTLPSLAEQKAAQLRAYKASQDRLAAMHSLNEKHLTLQSTLSTYLDQVEVNLLQQISRKSWRFFDALNNIHEVQKEIAECLQRIASLRRDVAVLKATLSDAGLGVLRQIRCIGHTQQLIRTLELLASVLATSPTVQLLLASGDFSAAMQLIHSTKQVLGAELAGLTCLRNVQQKLNEHSKLIGQMMQLEFVGVAVRGGSFYLHDFNAPAVSKIPASKLKHSIASSRSLNEEEQERLVPLVSHLLELGQVGAVFDAYRDELQSILKQRLMDLVFELLNQIQEKEEEEGDNDTNDSSDSDGDGSDGDEEEEEATARISERDKSAAITLLSDHQPSTMADERNDAPTPAPAPSSQQQPAPSTTPEVTLTTVAPPLPSSTPALAGASPSPAPAPVAPPVPVPTPPRYGERKQAAVAMPVHLQQQASPTPTSNAHPPVPPVSVSPAPNAVAPAAASGSASAAASPISPAAGSGGAGGSGSGSTNIGSRFSALQHGQFLGLLQPMFASLMDLIQRAASIRHVVLTVLSNSALPSAQKDAITRQLNDALLSLLEYVHGKVGRILQTRAGVHADLELRQLRQYLDVILSFIQEGEKVAGKTLYGLRGTLLVQAKAFLVNFHAKCLAHLAAALEQEKWVRVDVPAEYQHLLDAHFMVANKPEPARTTTPAPAPATAAAAGAAATGSAAMADPLAPPPSSSTAGSASSTPVALKAPLPTWQSKSWSEANEGDDDDGHAESNNNKQRTTTAPATAPATPVVTPAAPAAAAAPSSAGSPAPDLKRVLFVSRPPSGGSSSGVGTFLKFPVVSSLLVLLRIIGQYIECSSQLQAVGSDILNRLVELLQVFNSRSCQLVLGAGAMHLSGLKSITASHLALASQSVGLLVTQIPVLRAVLSRRLPAKHHVLLHSLDRVSRDCQEHQREIFAKLVAIMEQLVRDMHDKVLALPWARTHAAASAGAPGAAAGAAPAASPSPPLSAEEVSKVDDCVRTVMKQTCSLHRALSDLLLPEQRDLIFHSISHAFLTHFNDLARTLDTNDHTVKLKLSCNVHHAVTRLRTCTGTDESAIQQLNVFVL